jgi:hypothetical protein
MKEITSVTYDRGDLTPTFTAGINCHEIVVHGITFENIIIYRKDGDTILIPWNRVIQITFKGEL